MKGRVSCCCYDEKMKQILCIMYLVAGRICAAGVIQDVNSMKAEDVNKDNSDSIPANLRTITDDISRSTDMQTLADGIQYIADEIKAYASNIADDIQAHVTDKIPVIPNKDMSVIITTSKDCHLLDVPCTEAYAYIKKKYPEYLDKEERNARNDPSNEMPSEDYVVTARFLGGIGNAYCLGAIRSSSFCTNLYVMRICKAIKCI